jgi:hypothetical protein
MQHSVIYIVHFQKIEFSKRILLSAQAKEMMTKNNKSLHKYMLEYG